MAHVTMYLREVIELTSGNIGLDDYPIFDESHRDELNAKIENHYYFREIGFETIDIFVQRMRSKMNLIMPYYNKLYESEALEIDPLKTMDVWGENENSSSADGTSDSVSSGKTASASTSKSRSVTSEMPQSMLAEDEDYATSGVDAGSANEGSGSEASESRGSTSQTSAARGKSHSWGTSGSQAALLQAYRNTFLNIDHAIVRELEPLFLSILSVSDSYTPNTLSVQRWPWFGIGGML